MDVWPDHELGMIHLEGLVDNKNREPLFKSTDWASQDRPVEAVFTCAACGSTAATIGYLPPGQTTRSSESGF